MFPLVTECRQPHRYPHDIEVTSSNPPTSAAANDQLVTMQLHMKKSGETVTPSSTANPNGRSVLLLIPLRLGQDHFNMQYAEGLKVWHT